MHSKPDSPHLNGPSTTPNDQTDGVRISYQEIFQQELEDFKSKLSQRHKDEFAATKLEHVKQKVLSIQRDQERLKNMMNLSRMQLFLEKFGEFDTFCSTTKIWGEDSSEVSALLWGPPLYILKV